MPADMLRRLIACLALLTGIAATGAPAHAAFVGAVSERVASSDCSRAADEARCRCIQQRRNQGDRDENPRECKPRRTITIVIPTVQYGPDRAHE